jgi:uncharacterized protein (DUF1800 family)
VSAAAFLGRHLRGQFGRSLRLGLSAASLAVLAACGGASGEASGRDEIAQAQNAKPASTAEAAGFLTQASFGPTEADIARLSTLGYGAWIDEQLAKPAHSHAATWDARDAAAKALNATSSAGQDGVTNSFWQAAVTGEDQLRQRVAFALSQILVISMAGSSVGDSPRAVASYLDLLADKGLGNYRDLLEAVSLHPMMGTYLSHLRNQKADPRTGRVPDENYAREVMQLFSVGLVELDTDGTPRTDSTGKALETYTPADVAGLARVFTGWSWDCPDGPDNSCFFGGSVGGNAYADRTSRPMLGYAQFHSTEEKKFLGVTLAAQTRADPYASLKTGLDTLFNHPNVGPFIGRQLIQRLVTSNPSPAYVRTVAQTFNDNGAGVRGDMKAVIKAVLLHPEARKASDTAGKLREPVLRLTAYLRAFPHHSDTGTWNIGPTDDAGTALAQSAMRSPSVFNFYRPGYVPPGTQAAARGLAVPELQIAHETSAAGYVNYMRDAVGFGVGRSSSVSGSNRRDVQPDFTAELALAEQPEALVERVNARLLAGAMPAALKSEIVGAVQSIVIPAPTSSNATQVATAKRNRVNAAIFLALVSPEFLVQK